MTVKVDTPQSDPEYDGNLVVLWRKKSQFQRCGDVQVTRGAQEETCRNLTAKAEPPSYVYAHAPGKTLPMDDDDRNTRARGRLGVIAARPIFILPLCQIISLQMSLGPDFDAESL